jgi:ribosomal protein S18 acetylase RimI-like enzyme
MPEPGAPLIREYADKDVGAIRDCIAELQEFERGIDERLRPGHAMAAEYLAQMLDRCHDYAGTILVAECAGAVAGFVTVLAKVPFEELDDPPGEYALVTDLLVRESFRRRGLGGALLREAERCARLAGAAELRVGVLSTNYSARGLYRGAGFVPHLEILAKKLGGHR